MNTLSVVHDVLRRQVREGDFCIDATAGKGRDTALLCRLTGENGRVLHRVQFRPSARRRPDKIHHRRDFTACC